MIREEKTGKAVGIEFASSDKKIILSEEDRKTIVELYAKARTTPVMALSCADMIAGKDWASQAWDRAREKMDELGVKYGFDPKKMKGIDGKTGEVRL